MFFITSDIDDEMVRQLADNIRDADQQEAEALGVTDIENAIHHSLHHSSRAWAWLDNGRMVALLGVGPHPDDEKIGIPWMLGTDLVFKNKVRLMKLSREYLAKTFDGFERLGNFVDARNKLSIAWLKALGFTMADAYPMGPQDLPFHRFEMIREG